MLRALRKGGLMKENRGKRVRTSMFASAVIILCGIASLSGQDRPYHFSLPDGWQQAREAGAVAAAWSPDKSVQIRIYDGTANSSAALQLMQQRMKNIAHVKVFTPPTDMSRLASRFKADSVSKMHLGFLRKGDNKKCSYRAFIFVKQNRAILIDSLALFEAPEAVFRQADEVIESFKFR